MGGRIDRARRDRLAARTLERLGVDLHPSTLVGTLSAPERAGWAGLVGLRAVEPDAQGARPDDVEIGWIVVPTARGHGYASEAAFAMRDYAFGSVGLESLIARTASANAASMRVAEKLGMQLEGESPDGVWRTYRLSRDVWQRRAGGGAE